MATVFQPSYVFFLDVGEASLTACSSNSLSVSCVVHSVCVCVFCFADQRSMTGSGGSGAAASLSRGKSRSPGGAKGGGVGMAHELSPAIMPPEQVCLKPLC